MDLRKGDPYVSCIKVYGVPIIPPLMTDDVRTEMRYYKHLAIAVEERLKRLESLVQSEIYDGTETIEQTGLSSGEKSSNPGKVANCVETPINVPTFQEEECPSENKDKESRELESQECYSTENERTVPDDASSLDVTLTSGMETKTDVDDSLKSDKMTVTPGDTPERKKPEVPKTLDIIPITMDSTMTDETLRRGSEDSCNNSANSLMSEQPIESMTSSPISDETTPKLVRQGSYVLDAPSPMLLAHLREEKKSSMELTYAPTSNVSNSLKRREWNISEAKSEWELQRRKDNALVVKDTGCLANHRKEGARRNSASNASQARSVARRCAQMRPGTTQLGGTRRIARSADCIRSMLRRDSETSSVVMTNGRVKNLSFSSPSASSSLSPSPPLPSTTTTSHQRTRRGSISSLTNKLGNSLENLGKSNSRRYSERVALPAEKSSVRESPKNSEGDATPRHRVPDGSTDRIMSSVTSQKLADVFKQIQNTHERQMSELVARQQREQQRMREEFEKQRVLLLVQIERTFPGIKLSGFADKKISPNCRIIQRENVPEVGIDDTGKSITSPKRSNGFHEYDDKETVRCPLDDIYPREKSPKQPSSPPIGHVSSNQRKNYGVSRRLFPLESNTSHVPVYTAYEDRHVKAATIINAYARGYLVRRIMRTERVIALKTTYSEALRCMLKLHVDAPLALPELNFHQRLQLQCEAASMNIVELFTQEPAKRMEIIEQDRQIKRARQERPNSARSCYSFATQRTLARKKLKEMGDFQTILGSRSIGSRNRCQTWTSYGREKYTPSVMNQGIKRSTSAGAVRKPWR